MSKSSVHQWVDREDNEIGAAGKVNEYNIENRPIKAKNDPNNVQNSAEAHDLQDIRRGHLKTKKRTKKNSKLSKNQQKMSKSSVHQWVDREDNEIRAASHRWVTSTHCEFE